MHENAWTRSEAGFETEDTFAIFSSNRIQEQDACKRSSAQADANAALKFYQLRRTRDALFEPGIFSDPAWDILLKLFIAAKAREPVSAAAVCAAIGLPRSVGSRWLEILVQNGYVMRQGSADGALLTLTASTHRTLDGLFAQFESGDVA